MGFIKLLIKHKTSGLFGDYSEFIKPTQQRAEVPANSSTNVKVAATDRNITTDDQRRRNESQQQELLMNGTGGGEEQQQQRNEARF